LQVVLIMMKNLSVIPIAWILLAACQSSPIPAEGPAPTVAAIAEGAAPETQAPVAEVQHTQTAESAGPTTVRTELAATDPATVDLASGKPKLVEFFAFW
jgi:hypothetical protein